MPESNLIFVYCGARKRYRDSGNNQHVQTIQTVCTCYVLIIYSIQRQPILDFDCSMNLFFSFGDMLFYGCTSSKVHSFFLPIRQIQDNQVRHGTS